MGNVKLRVIAKEEMPAMMKTWKRMKLENVYALVKLLKMGNVKLRVIARRRDACDDENMEKNEAGECVCIGETSEDGECMSDRKRRDVCDDENMEKNEAGECVCIGETSEDGECMSDRNKRDVCD